MNNKNMKKKMNRVEAGKLGEKVSHRERYDILLTLSSKVDKALHNRLMKWPTKYLVDLLKINEKIISKN